MIFYIVLIFCIQNIQLCYTQHEGGHGLHQWCLDFLLSIYKNFLWIVREVYTIAQKGPNIVSGSNGVGLYLFISAQLSVSVSDRLWTAEGCQADRPSWCSLRTPTGTPLTHCQASTPLQLQTAATIPTSSPPLSASIPFTQVSHLQATAGTHKYKDLTAAVGEESGTTLLGRLLLLIQSVKQCNCV